jgi:hypothetical protein
MFPTQPGPRPVLDRPSRWFYTLYLFRVRTLCPKPVRFQNNPAGLTRHNATLRWAYRWAANLETGKDFRKLATVIGRQPFFDVLDVSEGAGA